MAKQTFTTGQVLTAAQMTSLQQTAMGGGSATAKTASYVLVAADAGTVVSMNAAGATTITINTGLFSAGDTVFIQNWGAGTCTVTAGTATVNTHGSLALSQYEGGTLYFTSSSTAIFFDISQTSGMTNPMTTTGDTIYSSSGSTPARLGIGTAGQVLTVNSGATAPEWAALPSSAPASDSATVATSQTVSSATYTDLATAGPAVTITTGTKALVIVSCLHTTATNIGDAGFMSFAVSGATTISASDAYASMNKAYVASAATSRQSAVTRLSTLTAGSNTFTAKYKNSGNTNGFANREICVINLGS